MLQALRQRLADAVRGEVLVFDIDKALGGGDAVQVQTLDLAHGLAAGVLCDGARNRHLYIVHQRRQRSRPGILVRFGARRPDCVAGGAPPALAGQLAQRGDVGAVEDALGALDAQLADRGGVVETRGVEEDDRPDGQQLHGLLDHVGCRAWLLGGDGHVLHPVTPGDILEVEAGVVGGEEDGVDHTGIDSSRLYTQPEEVAYAYEELSKISDKFTVAASFGNVHGVYKPGNVKLTPTILRDATRPDRVRIGAPRSTTMRLSGSACWSPA